MGVLCDEVGEVFVFVGVFREEGNHELGHKLFHVLDVLYQFVDHVSQLLVVVTRIQIGSSPSWKLGHILEDGLRLEHLLTVIQN